MAERAKALRVPGHTLRNEGAPFDDYGHRLSMGFVGRGRAKCSCGALSEVLNQKIDRQRWHQRHKEAIVASRGQGS